MRVALAAAFCAWAAQEPGGQQEPAARAPGDPSVRLESSLRDSLERWDPRAGGWSSEAFSEQVQERLAALSAVWIEARRPSAAALSPFLSEAFTTSPLRPMELETVLDGAVFQVRRGSATGEAAAAADRHGPEALAEWLAELARPFEGSPELRASWKTFDVEEGEGRVTTRSFFLAEGAPEAGFVQQNAVWVCEWTRPENAEPPLLRSIRVVDFEEVRGAPGGKSLFADATEALFGAESVFREQLLPGQNHWQSRLAASVGISSMGHQGVAIGDVDGDGLEDVFLSQPGGLPNRLFLRQPDGRLLDHSAAAGVDFLDVTRCALLVDLDNDGDLDLVLDLLTDLVMLSNDGSGRFTIEASGQAPETTMLAAADYDNDGRLDLYACGYRSPYGDEAVPTPYHDADNGLPNLLLRNVGDWRFEDVTASVGLDVNNERFSFAAAWEDYDNDGDQDLYVANDFGRNNLYRNDDGRFVDVAAEAGVEDIAAGMGVAWGDFNHDGWMDLYVSNMFSSAGNRIAYQSAFRAGSDGETLAEYRRHARGNSLFENLGDGRFREVSREANVAMGRWAWGAVFADLNNDAWLDLFVPNGFFTNERPDDL